jgi:hypothetical protein
MAELATVTAVVELTTISETKSAKGGTAMKLPLHILAICLQVVIVLAVMSAPSLATLGEGPDSIVNNRKALRSASSSKTTYHDKYTVVEDSTSGTTVRQYVSVGASPVVFAVAWNGLVPPDLQQYLGVAYNKEYETAKQQLPRTHGRKLAQVKGNHVVVETWGHMRDLRGRAYAPTLIPAGVDINEIH